jgi:hypothetical protein
MVALEHIATGDDEDQFGGRHPSEQLFEHPQILVIGAL